MAAASAMLSTKLASIPGAFSKARNQPIWRLAIYLRRLHSLGVTHLAPICHHFHLVGEQDRLARVDGHQLATARATYSACERASTKGLVEQHPGRFLPHSLDPSVQVIG